MAQKGRYFAFKVIQVVRVLPGQRMDLPDPETGLLAVNDDGERLVVGT